MRIQNIKITQSLKNASFTVYNLNRSILRKQFQVLMCAFTHTYNRRIGITLQGAAQRIYDRSFNIQCR